MRSSLAPTPAPVSSPTFDEDTNVTSDLMMLPDIYEVFSALLENWTEGCNSECFPDEFADHLVDGDLRVVLMVIDAWRLSFLTDDDSPMTFLRNSIQSGRAAAFAAAAQTPTVTMPRIQAVTSGVVPSLTSLLMNFFASEHTDDNWVNAAADDGRRIAFFGDDTWLRLFPNAFTQSDGVTSFFVSDYTEVQLFTSPLPCL
ncbi:unnamed protein product, partial [Nippostrongylus brasiliensis]|uniref:GPI ethanolamine phosphate transferase 2 (inferred by orthology to a human protein) n=1 Tax=Nippostrongylus brasiliensis TaxID=27835 RepID=A0A0N4YMI6_NIPBR